MSKKLYIVWGGMVFVIFIFILILGYSLKNTNKKYKNLEMNLEEAASIYLTESKLSLNDTESLKVDVSDLVKSGYIESVSVGKDDCFGYVLIKKDKKLYSYEAVIECTNYKTVTNK